MSESGSSTDLALPSSRGLDRKLSRGLAGFVVLVVALGSVFWALTGNIGLVAGVMAFYVIVGSLYLVGAWGSTRWLSRVCSAAARALEAGRIAEARTLLDDNLIRSAANTPMYAIAIWLRARVAIREGEFADARGRLEMLLGWHWYGRDGLLHAHAPQVRAHLVSCLALEGRLDQAEQQRALADDRREPRVWLLADALLLARRERFGELLDRLDQRAATITTLPRSEAQCLALLHAWASFRIARDEPGFRAPHASVDTPEPLQRAGFELEQVEFLTREWPELREFLRLSRRSRP